MAMQGKTTSGELSPLDVAEAEQAADAFRPSWADDDDLPPPAPAAAPPPVQVSAPEPARPASAAAILGSTAINQTLPLGALSAEAAAKIIVDNPSSQPGPVDAPASLNTSSYSAGSTRLGISPEAAALVAAANAAARAPGPAPSSEAIEPEQIIETAKVIPPAPKTEPLVVPIPEPSATIIDRRPPVMDAAVDSQRAAPPSVTPPNPVAPVAPFIAADPFAKSVPPPPASDPDIGGVPAKSSKAKVWIGIVAVAAVGIVAVVKLASPSSEPTPRPSTTTATGPAIQSPANDIPPPPDKEDLPAPIPTTTPAQIASAKAAEPPPVAKVAEAPPVVKATELPTKAAEPPPKPVAAVPPPQAHHEPRAKPAPPPPPPPVTKSAPKASGGGIVRDSPF